MSASPPSPHAFRVSDLPRKQTRRFELRPDAAALSALADRLGLLALRKLSFTGELIAEGPADWRLEAQLGATVVQPCGVTLDPVSTRVDTPVIRRYLRDYTDVDAPEVEMPEDDTAEPQGRWIDPEAVMEEALTLALPLYPRKEGAALGQMIHAEPGIAPMRDEDARPFAGLAALRDQLEDGSDKEGPDTAQKSAPGGARKNTDER